MRPRHLSLSRRDLLRGGGVAATAMLVGCTDNGSARPSPSASSPPMPDPDIAVLAEAADAERALLAAYLGPVRAAPSRAGLVRSLRLHHEAHLADLLSAMAALGAPVASAAPSASTHVSASASPSSLPAPAKPAGVTPAALRRQEQSSGQAATAAVAHVGDGDVALLLAEIGASHAQHVVALNGLE